MTPRTIAEHRAAVLARVSPVPAGEVALDDPAVLGLALADDVVAATAVPGFDHAAMDGYAVRLADLPADGTPVTLPVLADVRPGRPADPATTGTGGAVRIMTGAPLPAGLDAVVPVERTSTGRFVAGGPSTERTVTLARQARDHVRRTASDVPPGALLAKAGAPVHAGVVAAAVAAGVTTVSVRRRPRVAVLSTGSELVPLGTGGPGTVPDSNSLMLAALVRAAGADVVRVGAVPDDAAALGSVLDRVTAPGGAVDLVVSSGGVSAGASDVVREVLATGVADAVDVAAVAMRPGRPQALATWHGVPWVAVPGNPVSAFVSTVLYVLPAVRRLAGLTDDPALAVPAATGWTSPAGAEQVLPVRLGPDGATPAGPGGHHLSALADADALAVVPANVDQVRPGDVLPVLRLPEPR
ncbi:gephyrin-like molybdotransferase Glp [Isoptericola jiangsuensis]|uniref:molybdopterin molybdotransferase MoeA n=1 Tax=Isoptericola jiangsuensis TaxID=548579 RepID=UPI001FE856B7|nr:gephyrin-like molybdotransferase Glp [Isoptericola jiangsuensis]